MRRFSEYSHVLAWFERNNPARARPFLYTEPETKPRPPAEQFSGEHPYDIHASIAAAISEFVDRRGMRDRSIWYACELGRPKGRVHPDDAAKALHISRSTVYRVLQRIREDLERAFKFRELLE